MQPQGYIPRLIDEQIETLLQIFGAVQIDGPKWCGKTWSGQAHANSMTSLDDQNVLPLAEADPTIALIGEQPHLIDEWQTAPKVRDAVRHDIDSHSNRPGQYILTGSSAPPTEAYEHSGAGRIAHLRMWPMSLVELGKSSGVVSLQGLFASNCPQAAASSSLTDIAEWVCRGGWPASKDRSLQAALYIPRQYLDAVIEDNAPRMGKNPAMTRRTIMSLARNNCI